MRAAIGLSATLHDIVRKTVASFPGSERGSLLVSDGEHLIGRAAVGYDQNHLRCWRIPLDGQFDPRLGLSIHRAAEWYARHLPAGALPDIQVLADATVVVVPIVGHGRLVGLLNVEQPAATPPNAEQQMILTLLAENTAFILERHGLYQELARSTEEVRLLGVVLDAVASSNELDDVIHTVGYGIKNALPYQRWHTVRLAILQQQRQQLHQYEILGRRINPYWSNVGNGASNAGRDLEVEVTFVLATGDGRDTQVEVIDAGIRDGVHGIAVAATNPVLVEAAIRRARHAGIPVIAYDTPPIEDSQALLYIGTDNMAAGRVAGEMFARLLPAGGLVAVATDSNQTLNARQRLAGFQAAIADTAIELLPACVDNHSVLLGQQLAAATLAEHPDLAGIFGMNASSIPNWGPAIEAVDKVEQVRIVGFDMVADTISMLKAGIADVAIAQHEYDMGYRSVQILCQMIVDGIEQTLAQLPASRFVDTGIEAVTLDRTPWSISLADYIDGVARRHSPSPEQRRAVASYGKPIKILVVGVAEQAESSTGEQDIAFQPNSVAGQVVASGRSLIIDPLAPAHADLPEAIQARQAGIRTIVSTPLVDRGDVVGLLSLESQIADACTPADLALVERIAHAGSMVIGNARLFDQVAERTRELEMTYRRQEMLLQTIMELSSPVAPIIPGILVMPLVGTFDTQRAGRFIETLLHEISDRHAHIVLIDITGVSVVDTGVAHNILRAEQAAKLLGAEVVLVGITPVVAQTMVQLGLEMQRIATRSDLESGFAYALERMRGKIVFNK
jgi:ABC-type sugar transport system substrate-binding protein/anti-anti-sigma regulatory factor